MAAPVLALTGISKRFGQVQALSDVDLEVRAGEVVVEAPTVVRCRYLGC